MIWLISEFPELDHLDPAERAQALRHVPWWTYPQLVTGAFIGAVVTGSATLLFAYSHGLGGWAAWAPGFVVAAVIFIQAYVSGLKGIRRAMRAELIKCFRGRRPPFCLICGYDLRASTSDTCAECGQSILTVPTRVGRFARFLGRRIGACYFSERGLVVDRSRSDR